MTKSDGALGESACLQQLRKVQIAQQQLATLYSELECSVFQSLETCF
jgi:hypothetical protein